MFNEILSLSSGIYNSSSLFTMSSTVNLILLVAWSQHFLKKFFSSEDNLDFPFPARRIVFV